jgi:hypothetical protein
MSTTLRFSEPSVNGHVAPDAPAAAPKPKRAKAAPKAKPRPAVETKADLKARLAVLERRRDGRLHRWAQSGVYVSLVLSAGLNGYTSSLHASEPIWGWAVGISIPAIVLILSKVAGLQAKKGRWWTFGLTALAGVGLLGLSVWHCAEALALLTGVKEAWRTIAQAIAIDCGLVACEAAVTMEE